MKKWFVVITLASILAISLVQGNSFAHQSGCHRWHSCPSDSGSYVCGDLGYYSQCPSYYYPKTEPKEETSLKITSPQIPDWVRNTAGWWSTGQVSDSEFILSLQYLIQNDILQAPQESIEQINDKFPQPKYHETLNVPITGTVKEFRSGYVYLNVEKPDGKTLEIKFPVAEIHNDNTNSGTYSGLMIITHDDPVGVYRITGKYQGEEVENKQFSIVEGSGSIPDWIKNNAKWWFQDFITDDDFLLGIKYLITNGIIKG